MTNLRDALEKAGVTPGDQADLAADNVVDELAKMISDVAPQNDHAPLEEDRPKLVENNAELASVVDRIEELVTGQPAADAPPAEIAEQEDAGSATTEDAENLAEQMRAAAELTHEQPPTAPTVDIGSIPMLQTDQISEGLPIAGGFSEEIQSIDDHAVSTDENLTTDDAADEPAAEFSSYDPLGIEDEISVGASQFEPTTESTSEESEFDAFESFDAITADQPAQNDASDYPADTAEEIAETVDPVESTAVHPPEVPTNPQFPDLEIQSDDTGGFNPHMIPGVKPGNAMSMVTTDESNVDDPIAAANELTGDFVPQDLSEFEQSEDQDDDFDQIEFVESDQSAFDTSSVSNAALANAAGARLGTVEPKPSFLQTTNLKTTSEQNEFEQQPTQQPLTAAAPVVALAATAGLATVSQETVSQETVGQETTTSQTEVATPPPTPVSIPTTAPISTEATDSDEATQFEQHVLENLTKSPCASEYQQLAESVLSPDLNTEPNTICFLSAEDSSHAAKVVSHLAVVFSTLKNKKVLVVDANGCPDNITRSFRKDKQPGLKNMTSVNDDWLDMALPTAVPNLFILPAGWRRGGATHWEAGEFAGLIPLFTRQFDLVLIDGGVAERTEDTPFYAACDRTLMLVRLGQTDRDMARAVRNGLKSANVQLDGCVITNHPA